MQGAELKIKLGFSTRPKINPNFPSLTFSRRSDHKTIKLPPGGLFVGRGFISRRFVCFNQSFRREQAPALQKTDDQWSPLRIYLTLHSALSGGYGIRPYGSALCTLNSALHLHFISFSSPKIYNIFSIKFSLDLHFKPCRT